MGTSPTDEPGAAPGAGSGLPAQRGVRIAAVEAAIAAGLAPSTGRRFDTRADAPASESPTALQLPDWTEPPTGQVPRVLLGGNDDGMHALDGSVPRGPTWREDRSDWDEDLDLSFLVEEGEKVGIAGHASEPPREDDPFNFAFGDLGVRASSTRVDDPVAGGTRTSTVSARPAGPAEAGTRRADAGALVGARDIDDAAWEQLLAEDAPPALGGVDAAARRRARQGRRSRRGGRNKKGDETALVPPDATGGAEEPGLTGPQRVELVVDDPVFEREPTASWNRRDRRPGHVRRARAHRGKVAVAGAVLPREKAAAGRGRSPLVATATGVVAGGVALACFGAGPVSSLVLVTTLVTLAAGEAFGALRRAGQRPLAPVGLVAVAAMMVGAYLHGPVAIPTVLTATVGISLCWYLLASRRSQDQARRAVAGLSGTLLVVVWVGLLGSFGGLLLDPAAFPHRHGIALLVAAVLLTVAADVGAYAVGSRYGTHLIAPRISPHKSWEGFAGGSVLTLAAAGLIVARIHPFTLSHALYLGGVVLGVAPIGDLAESLVKRDLGVKDMGSLLPAHGGVLDRVDAMLFVLPAAYYLARLVHLS